MPDRPWRIPDTGPGFAKDDQFRTAFFALRILAALAARPKGIPSS